MDVWRQRHLAEALEEFHRGRRQLDAPQLRLAREHAHHAACRRHLEPGADGLAGRKLRQRLRALERTLEQYLHAAARGLVAAEPRSDDSRIVDDQQIARTQLRGQVRDRSVENRTGHPIQYQHAPG